MWSLPQCLDCLLSQDFTQILIPPFLLILLFDHTSISCLWSQYHRRQVFGLVHASSVRVHRVILAKHRLKLSLCLWLPTF